jgi:localization factor PodJL
MWTQRAADNGERKAMHNLGLYYFEGTGGAKNLALAAQWFRKAADMGLVDSQYNLARLYEGGFGVAQNSGEAYKWYLVASRSGDAESRAAAERLKAQLPAAAARADEASAETFHPTAPAATLQTASR